MTVPKHDTTRLDGLSDGDLMQETHSFAETIRGHEAFKNLQEHVPGADRFDTLEGKLGTASEAAKHGDKRKGEERDNIREEIIRSFTFACQHAVMVATYRNDPSLMDIGLELKHRSYAKPATATPPGQPTKVNLSSGPKGSGIAFVTVNKIAGMKSVEVQYTENPNDESSWLSAERSYTCKIQLKLDLVKRYYVRVRFHNSAGYGPWSAVVDIVLG